MKFELLSLKCRLQYRGFLKADLKLHLSRKKLFRLPLRKKRQIYLNVQSTKDICEARYLIEKYKAPFWSPYLREKITPRLKWIPKKYNHTFYP